MCGQKQKNKKQKTQHHQDRDRRIVIIVVVVVVVVVFDIIGGGVFCVLCGHIASFFQVAFLSRHMEGSLPSFCSVICPRKGTPALLGCVWVR